MAHSAKGTTTLQITDDKTLNVLYGSWSNFNVTFGFADTEMETSPGNITMEYTDPWTESTKTETVTWSAKSATKSVPEQLVVKFTAVEVSGWYVKWVNGEGTVLGTGPTYSTSLMSDATVKALYTQDEPTAVSLKMWVKLNGVWTPLFSQT